MENIRVVLDHCCCQLLVDFALFVEHYLLHCCSSLLFAYIYIFTALGTCMPSIAVALNSSLLIVAISYYSSALLEINHLCSPQIILFIFCCFGLQAMMNKELDHYGCLKSFFQVYVSQFSQTCSPKNEHLRLMLLLT